MRIISKAIVSFCLLTGCATDTTSSTEEDLGSPPPATIPADLVPFLATWQYQSGSGFTISCGGNVVQSVDLFHAGTDGEPATFSFLPQQVGLGPITDGVVHELDGLGCEYNFAIAGKVASLGAGATCNKIPDGQGGFMLETSIGVTKTLVTSQTGPRLAIAGSAAIGAHGECMLSVAGSARRLYGAGF